MISSESQRRVLVVDDEPLIRAILKEGLAREGFSCQEAGEAQEALKTLENEPFDILVSDLRMPGPSGLELLKTARAKYPRMVFLMATGVADVRVGVEAMRHGADDYFVKPLQLDAVVAAIHRGLEKKRLELELENYRDRLEEMVERRTQQLQMAVQRVEQTYEQTLRALGGALDLRDTDTEGHSRRVTFYSLELARKLGCSHDELRQILYGSYLHDIGKIGIPDAILLKNGVLTSEEVAVMQTHARIGYELVSRIPFLAAAAELVLTHQEAYDGSGYPQQLQGEAIPLGARIFALADTLDAMTSDRPYRRALPMAVARDTIRRECGRQFDPRVAEAFFSIPEDVWNQIHEEVGLRAGPHPIFFQEVESLSPTPGSHLALPMVS